MTDKKQQINACLDEIEASFLSLEDKTMTVKGAATLNSWIRFNKSILKELKYRGKMPRKKRSS